MMLAIPTMAKEDDADLFNVRVGTNEWISDDEKSRKFIKTNLSSRHCGNYL